MLEVDRKVDNELLPPVERRIMYQNRQTPGANLIRNLLWRPYL